MSRLITVLGLSLALFACAQEGPAEQAGEALDDAAGRGGDTAGRVGDTARDIRDDTEDFADRVRDDLDDNR